MNGEQIYKNFQEGNGTDSLEQMANRLAQLKDSYANRAESIAGLQKEMTSAWTGDAGAQASEGAVPLAFALAKSAANFDQTVDSMASQSFAWNSAANSVEPVPPIPEKPSPWSTGLKAAIPVAGPFMAADDVKSYQEGVAAHNEASLKNVYVMEGYTASTSSNANFPREYETLQPGSAVINLRPSTPNAISGELSNIPGTTHSSGVSGPVSTATPTSGHVTGAVPNVGTPVSTGGVPTHSVSPSGPGVNTPNVSGGTPGTPTTVAGTTGAVPPGGGPSTRNTSRSTPGFGRSTVGGTGTPRGTTGTPRTSTGTGSERGTGLNQRAGSRLYGTGTGTGSGAGGAARGVGEGVAGRGASAEAGSRALGAGKGVGAGLGGSAAAAESAAAKGAATGSRGAMGGPMGAGGRRGEGSEDEEHQRASYLQENDPDEVFIGDLGRTAPPVIGE